MIERVARAICEALSAGLECEVRDDKTCKCNHGESNYAAAQAAIAAMWTPFDAEDESTWPEKDAEYLVRMPFNSFSGYQWSGNPKHWAYVTSYMEIPEGK